MHHRGAASGRPELSVPHPGLLPRLVSLCGPGPSLDRLKFLWTPALTVKLSCNLLKLPVRVWFSLNPPQDGTDQVASGGRRCRPPALGLRDLGPALPVRLGSCSWAGRPPCFPRARPSPGSRGPGGSAAPPQLCAHDLPPCPQTPLPLLQGGRWGPAGPPRLCRGDRPQGPTPAGVPRFQRRTPRLRQGRAVWGAGWDRLASVSTSWGTAPHLFLPLIWSSSPRWPPPLWWPVMRGFGSSSPPFLAEDHAA